MTKIVVANQKMNMSLKDVNQFIDDIKGKIKSKNVIICPSTIYIPYFLNYDFNVGIQDVFYEEWGAYTGFISPLQVKEMSVNYVLIGHSEQRRLNDNNDVIHKKVLSATKHGLNVILCVGETLEERKSNKVEQVLKTQIFTALDEVPLKHVIIAYEPVWSIGTGLILDVKEIQKIILKIKMMVKEYMYYDDIPVIYGGSITSKNIDIINGIKNLSGVLIGDASCSSSEVLKIKEVVLGK